MLKSIKVFTLIFLVVVLVACNGGQSSTSTSSGSTNEEAGQNSNEVEESNNEEDRTLVIGIPTDIKSFDIHDHNQIITEAVHINIFSYLLKRDKEMEVQPDLVKDYKVIDDEVWEFDLKEGVTFHNGDVLTANDVKFTLERVAKDEALTEHSRLKVIKEVKVLDDHKFQIITDGPQPTLINLLSRIGSGILPQKYIEENGWDHFLSNPIGSGAFKFVEWRRDDRIILEPYENYYGGNIQDVDQVVFRVVPEVMTRINELITGGVDIVTDLTPDDITRIEDAEGVSATSAPSQRVALLGIQHREGYVTSDPKVREAIELAIDNEAITEHVLKGEATPTRTRVTPGNFGSNPDLFNTQLYDIERAKQLLQEAGYPNGVDITLTVPSDRYLKSKEVNETIAAMLKQAGINVNVQFVEYSRFVEMRNTGDFGDLYFAAYGNSLFDGSIALEEFATETGKERAGYENQEIADLWNEAHTNMNTQVRSKQYQKIQEIVAEERPHLYLYLQNEVYGTSDKVNFTPRTDSMIVIEDFIQ
ncbi:ABC transporter substrate-binding protein [Oceanobacillus damuensis]|uniref:ABC transporter substrate-binding protein n=1 Tax=Oceanobacillus damuensis TaxID=937928 RepID=UPI000835C6E2|nr:ABC transporter substrate-binding protein [Oceanobacillus damuensis]